MAAKIKLRLDELLVKSAMVATRTKAQALILAGHVEVNGQVENKAGSRFAASDKIKLIKRDGLRYVSRGGLKLEGALSDLGIDPTDKTILDAGASTGGFSDCLLQKGAKLVYAVDVGHGIIHEKLRNHQRVRLMEKTNARSIVPGMFDPIPDMAVIDVSFISLTKVLPAITACLKPDSLVLALVKPQFEAKKGEAKRGVVKDDAIRQRVVQEISDFASKELDVQVIASTASKLPGPEGNIEYFLLLKSSH